MTPPILTRRSTGKIYEINSVDLLNAVGATSKSTVGGQCARMASRNRVHRFPWSLVLAWPRNSIQYGGVIIAFRSCRPLSPARSRRASFQTSKIRCRLRLRGPSSHLAKSVSVDSGEDVGVRASRCFPTGSEDRKCHLDPGERPYDYTFYP